MSEVTRETIVESIKSLPLADQWAVMESALKALKASSKPTKAKKVKDPNAPKKEATWWVKRTCEVREALKEVIASENTARKSRGEKALPAVVAVRVASMLRDAGKLTKDDMPSQDEILTTWTTFLTSPPETKPKPVKEPKALKESKPKTKKTSEKKVEPAPTTLMTELFGEEEAETEVEVEVEAEAETEVAPYEWKFNFGKGEKTYERLDYEGKAYIYDNDTKAFLGLFMDKLKKLNTKAIDPLV
jgi:hypothetical protein